MHCYLRYLLLGKSNIIRINLKQQVHNIQSRCKNVCRGQHEIIISVESIRCNSNILSQAIDLQRVTAVARRRTPAPAKDDAYRQPAPPVGAASPGPPSTYVTAIQGSLDTTVKKVRLSSILYNTIVIEIDMFHNAITCWVYWLFKGIHVDLHTVDGRPQTIVYSADV